jgi:DNA-binding MarR family transcriptional regulator
VGGLTKTSETRATPGNARWQEQDYRDQADFRCALRQFLRFAEEQAREAGITPQQHVLLAIVRGHDGYPAVTIGEIADSLQVRQSSASLLVDRCVKRGLLNREEDTVDRRRAVVSLTPEGQQILDTIMAANRKQLGSLRDQLFRESFLTALRTHAMADSDGN